MAAGSETAVDTRGRSTFLQDSIGTMVSKVLAAKVMADKEREYAKKQAWKQGIDEAQFDAMNPPGYFFKKALVGEFGGFAIKKKKQELAALYRKGLLLGKITKNKKLRGKVIGQLKQSLIYSKANLKNAKKFRSQFDYNDYDEMFAPQDKKVPNTRKKVQNALGGGSGKRVSREQIIESIDAIAKSIERTAQSITQSSASVYGTLIVSNQLQADVAQDLKIRNSTLEDKLQKLVDVISNQTQTHREFIDKKEAKQNEAQLEKKTVGASAEVPDDLRTAVNESRTYSTFANEQEMMDPYLNQPPEVRPINSMVNDLPSMEAYGLPKAERGGTFVGNGPLELHGTEALASDSGVKIVSGPDSGYLHKINEPTSVIPLDNNYTQGEPSAVDGKTRPEPQTSIVNNITNKNNKVQQFELGTNNNFAPAALNIKTDVSQPLVDAMSLPMMAAGGGILASTTQYINSMGAAGDDVRPEIAKVTRSVANVFGLPSTIATKATGTKTFGKPKQEKTKKEDKKEEKKSLFDKMKEGFGKFMELLGKKINDADPSGGGGGGDGGPNNFQGSTGQEQAMNFFMGKGLTAEQSAGIVGNLMQESTAAIDPKARNSQGNRGIAQWDANRWGQFEKWAAKKGLDVNTREAQLQWIWEEMRTGSGGLGIERFKSSAKTSDQAAALFLKDYERSGEVAGQHGFDVRLQNAKELVRRHGSAAKPTTPAATPTTPVAGTKQNKRGGGTTALSRADTSKAPTAEQQRVAAAARKEADAMGLTGKDKAEYVAQKVEAVPSPIFQRPSQDARMSLLGEISTNPRQNTKPQIIALNTGSKNTSSAGAAAQQSLEEGTVPSGQNPLKNSGIYLG